MICAGLSDILHPGGMLSENSCRVRAFVIAVRARGYVTLYVDNADTLYIHYVNRHVRFVPPSRPQYTLRRESQQRSNTVGLAKVYSVCTSNLASHHVVVCAERNRVFSIIIISIIVVVIIVTMHYVNGLSTSRCGHFCKIALQKFIYISHFI